ncbi:hypothetical protein JCM10207_007106 [Rhodosporidiobolus poonsookiae]
MSSDDKPKQAFYPSGHDQSVLANHRLRTATNSAPHLLPHLLPRDSLLDVGCGPGTITVSFAPRVARVVGVEHPSAGQAVLDEAQQLAREQGVEDKVSFQLADAFHLPFPDDSFDVVYCHQVLQHVPDPATLLREMRRVSKRLVAAREADRGTFVLHPHDDDDRLARFDELWYAAARAGGGEPDAARRLKGWAIEAGFEPAQVDVQAGTTCPDPRQWGAMWAERTVKSGFADKVVELGLADREELERIAAAWREWAEKDEAWFGYLQGDLLAWKGRD